MKNVKFYVWDTSKGTAREASEGHDAILFDIRESKWWEYSADTNTVIENTHVGNGAVPGALNADGSVLMNSNYKSTDRNAIATIGMVEGVVPSFQDISSPPSNLNGKDGDMVTWHEVGTSNNMYSGVAPQAFDPTAKSQILIDGNVAIGAIPAADTLMTITDEFNSVVLMHTGGGIPHEDGVITIGTLPIAMSYRGIFGNMTYWEYTGTPQITAAIGALTTSTAIKISATELTGRNRTYKRDNGEWRFIGIEDVHSTVAGATPTRDELKVAISKTFDRNYAMDRTFTLYAGGAIGAGTATKGFLISYYANGSTRTVINAAATFWILNQTKAV